MTPPIIGQQPEVVLWQPTVLVRCPCQSNTHVLLLLTGFYNAVECGHCHMLHIIKGIAIHEGQAVPVVERVPPAQKGVLQ